MRMGALLGPIVEPTDHRSLAEQARAYVDAGYTSLWSAHAIGRGFMVTDPFVALTAAATAVGSLDASVEIGTAVLQLPLYHPIDVAHKTYSLQQMCDSRFVLGVGAGSTETEFNLFERDYSSRFAEFNKHVDALRQAFQADPNPLTPWPNVAEGPALYYGTWGNGVKRAAQQFDGWIASGHYRSVDEVCQAHADYTQAGGGRSIVSTLQIDGKTDLGEMGEKLVRFAEAGFDDAVIMRLPGAPTSEAIRRLID